MRIAVLGAGAWGSALALQLVRAGNQVSLWTRQQSTVDVTLKTGCIPNLNGIALPNEILLTSDLDQALQDTESLLISVPSHAFEATLQPLSHRTLKLPIAWATKGFHGQDHRLLHQLVQQYLPNSSATILSGPTFAAEVAKGLPTAIVAASQQVSAANDWAQRLHNATFRVYTHDDVIGVEMGGALKNVMAIAAGIADGLGYGANARAALISRALAEIMRLGECMGARQETFMGLTGLGDLVLTCTDNQSRNRRFGLAIAQQQSIEQAESSIGTVEGIAATHSAFMLSQIHQIEMPIVQVVHAILNAQLSPQEAVLQLLSRSPKSE